MDEVWLSWLAGLIDGEGSFVLGLRKSKMKAGYDTFTFSPVVNLKMHIREADVLDAIYNKLEFGKRYTIDEGKLSNYKHRHTPSTSWQTVKSSEAFVLSVMLWPYLVIKKRQAELMAIAAYLIARHWQREYYNFDIGRLGALFEIRDMLNPGTYRNKSRHHYTMDEVEGIVREQGELRVPRKKNKLPEPITDEMLELAPSALKEKIFDFVSVHDL